MCGMPSLSRTTLPLLRGLRWRPSDSVSRTVVSCARTRTGNVVTTINTALTIHPLLCFNMATLMVSVTAVLRLAGARPGGSQLLLALVRAYLPPPAQSESVNQPRTSMSREDAVGAGGDSRGYTRRDRDWISEAAGALSARGRRRRSSFVSSACHAVGGGCRPARGGQLIGRVAAAAAAGDGRRSSGA